MVTDGLAEPLDEIATPETVQPPGHRGRGHQDGSGQLRSQLAGATAYLVDPACADGQAVPQYDRRRISAWIAVDGWHGWRAKEGQPAGLSECLIRPDQLELDVLRAARDSSPATTDPR